MILELPSEFVYVKNNQNYAFTQKNVLYLSRNVSLRKIMYESTYSLRGKRRCFYCGCKCEKEDITLDHIYPQHLGGPTITSNLVPACSRCNEEKSGMSREEYTIYRGLDSIAKKDFRLKHESFVEQIKYLNGFYLPSEWVTLVDTKKIIAPTVKGELGCKIKMIENYYKTYNNFPKTLIVDTNYYILANYNIYRFAVAKRFRKIPCTVLENAQVLEVEKK